MCGNAGSVAWSCRLMVTISSVVAMRLMLCFNSKNATFLLLPYECLWLSLQRLEIIKDFRFPSSKDKIDPLNHEVGKRVGPVLDIYWFQKRTRACLCDWKQRGPLFPALDRGMLMWIRCSCRKLDIVDLIHKLWREWCGWEDAIILCKKEDRYTILFFLELLASKTYFLFS